VLNFFRSRQMVLLEPTGIDARPAVALDLVHPIGPSGWLATGYAGHDEAN
jgi:hypothetical protein